MSIEGENKVISKSAVILVRSADAGTLWVLIQGGGTKLRFVEFGY